MRRGTDADYRAWAAQNLKARENIPTHPDRDAVYGCLPKQRAGATIEQCLQPDLRRPLSAPAGAGKGSGRARLIEAEPLIAARRTSRPKAGVPANLARPKPTAAPPVPSWPAPLPSCRLGKWGGIEGSGGKSRLRR